MRWKLKARIQNCIERFPRAIGDPLYHLLQHYFGGLRNSNPQLQVSAAARIVALLHDEGRTVDGTSVLEIGTGWSVAMPVSLWLAGVATTTTVDVSRHVSEKLVLRDVAWILRHADEVRKVFGPVGVTDAFAGRLARLAQCRSLAEVTSTAGIRYLAPADAATLPHAAASFDYQVSFTVLEHIPPETIRQILREGNRVLKSDGLFVHIIDLSDHFAHTDRSIASIHFLRYDDDQWRDLAGNRFMYMNRLRIDEMLELFRSAPVHLLRTEAFVNEEALQILRQEFPLARRFHGLALERIATTRVDVVAAPVRSVEGRL